MEDYKIVSVTPDNISEEHICCGFSDKKCREGYLLKKELIKNRYQEGFRFKKFNIRGKVFIEFVPAEYAWNPVSAPGYMFINCFWVSGKYKGQGYGKRLLQECIDESKDKNGLVAIVGDKKRPFLSDKKFLLKQEFEICDICQPYFELVVKKFKSNATAPSFLKSTGQTILPDYPDGFVFFYSNQCTFTENYVQFLKEMAESHSIPVKIVKLNSLKAAQEAPVPFTIFSIFFNGKFVTHEILSPKRFEKFIESQKKN